MMDQYIANQLTNTVIDLAGIVERFKEPNRIDIAAKLLPECYRNFFTYGDNRVIEEAYRLADKFIAAGRGVTGLKYLEEVAKAERGEY